MAAPEAQKYLEAQIQTANKEQLLLMLLDGALRFSRSGSDALARSDFEVAHNQLSRAQQIMLELICAMDRTMEEPLYSNLCNLYKFVYFRLLDANLKKSTERIDEAVSILTSLRQTWSMAIEIRHKEGFAAPVGAAGAERKPIGINVEG